MQGIFVAMLTTDTHAHYFGLSIKSFIEIKFVSVPELKISPSILDLLIK